MLARKTNLKDNLTDVMRHLLVRSDPIVRSHRKILTCSLCTKTGHTKRSCPDRPGLPFNAYDDIVQDFFVT